MLVHPAAIYRQQYSAASGQIHKLTDLGGIDAKEVPLLSIKCVVRGGGCVGVAVD